MSISLTADDLKLLDDADLAAFTARQKWIHSTRNRRDESGTLLSPDKQGKQLPPMDDPDWSILIFRAGRGLAKPFR